MVVGSPQCPALRPSSTPRRSRAGAQARRAATRPRSDRGPDRLPGSQPTRCAGPIISTRSPRHPGYAGPSEGPKPIARDLERTLFSVTHQASARAIAEDERRVADIEALQARRGGNVRQVEGPKRRAPHGAARRLAPAAQLFLPHVRAYRACRSRAPLSAVAAWELGKCSAWTRAPCSRRNDARGEPRGSERSRPGWWCRSCG